MAKKGTLRAVLVGCGGMSRAWLSAAAERSDVDIVGLVDIDEKSLADLGQWPWPRTLVADLAGHEVQLQLR